MQVTELAAPAELAACPLLVQEEVACSKQSRVSACSLSVPLSDALLMTQAVFLYHRVKYANDFMTEAKRERWREMPDDVFFRQKLDSFSFISRDDALSLSFSR